MTEGYWVTLDGQILSGPYETLAAAESILNIKGFRRKGRPDFKIRYGTREHLTRN